MKLQGRYYFVDSCYFILKEPLPHLVESNYGRLKSIQMVSRHCSRLDNRFFLCSSLVMEPLRQALVAHLR